MGLENSQAILKQLILTVYYTRRLIISTCQSATVTGVALDVTGRWLLQLFYHVNMGGFLPAPLQCGQCDISYYPITPRITPLPLEAVKSDTVNQ